MQYARTPAFRSRACMLALEATFSRINAGSDFQWMEHLAVPIDFFRVLDRVVHAQHYLLA